MIGGILRREDSVVRTHMRKVIRKRIHHDKDGVQVSGDVQATIAANVGRKVTRTSVQSRQRIVRRSDDGKVGEREARQKK